MKAKARVKRADGMNRSERQYAAHLQEQLLAGRIARWDREPESLRLADNTTYRPDFRVVALDGTVEMHEVKVGGARYYDPAFHHAHRDGWVKLKVAAELHPYSFFLIWPDKGEWKRREI